MKTFGILLDQHKALKALMKNIEGLIKKAPNNIEPINKEFQKFKDLFSLHDDLEEKVLYKRLLENAKLHELILKAQQAHHTAKTILFELRVLSFANENWLPKFLILKDNILAHMEEEEEIIFKKAEQVVPVSKLEDLRNELEEFIKIHK